jgi:hypothetical protein
MEDLKSLIGADYDDASNPVEDDMEKMVDSIKSAS